MDWLQIAAGNLIKLNFAFVQIEWLLNKSVKHDSVIIILDKCETLNIIMYDWLFSHCIFKRKKSTFNCYMYQYTLSLKKSLSTLIKSIYMHCTCMENRGNHLFLSFIYKILLKCFNKFSYRYRVLWIVLNEHICINP